MCESRQRSVAGETVKPLLPLQDTSSLPCRRPQKTPKALFSQVTILSSLLHEFRFLINTKGLHLLDTMRVFFVRA